MKQSGFYTIFLDLLRDLFDAENQIVEALPKMVQASSHRELKEALAQHLDETKHQVQRLKTIFKMLNENPTGKRSQAMQALLAEGAEIINQQLNPSVKDAALIVAAQKVEHYEIAGYGGARAFAESLKDAKNNADYDEIIDLLQETLDEEGAADSKLTSIATGGFFTTGINEEAEQESLGRDS